MLVIDFRFVRVCTPADFFLIRSTFLIFLLQIFLSIYFQYGHIWYQNDGNEMFYQTLKMYFSKIFILEFLGIFFIIFRYIFCHSELDLRPKVTNFKRFQASSICNYLAKTASKLVHSFVEV